MGSKKAQEKKELILEAARRCMKKSGIHQLNLRDVAKEADISLGSIHYYFDSKEEVLMELFQILVNENVSTATAATAQDMDADPLQHMITVLDVYMEMIFEDPDSSRVIIDLWSQALWHKPTHELLQSYYGHALSWLVSLINEGNELGLCKVPDPEAAAPLFQGIFDGIMAQVNLLKPKLDKARMKKAAREFIRLAFKAEGD